MQQRCLHKCLFTQLFTYVILLHNIYNITTTEISVYNTCITRVVQSGNTFAHCTQGKTMHRSKLVYDRRESVLD